jgi:hypothetical protein
VGSTSMLPALHEPEAPSAGEVQGKHPRGHLCWSLAPVGRRAHVLHVFIDVRKLRLDPSARRSRGRFVAACASHDFCRSMFQRARQWTARTSRTSGIRGRDGCRLDRSSPFDRGQTAEGTQGQGPRITEPRRSLPGLLPEETSPQPRSLQTPRVAGIARRPVRS